MDKNKAIKLIQGIEEDGRNVTSEHIEALSYAVSHLEDDRWIPVSERLPEEKEMVLVTCEDLYLKPLNPCIGWRNEKYWNTFTASGCKQILYPTHWKPLPPKPYESEA